jgi:hypothetical protein
MWHFPIAILWFVAAGFLFAAKSPAAIAFLGIGFMYLIFGINSKK